MAKLFGNQQARIVMLGLDAAGKTTILYSLQIGEVTSTIPTIGFNVEILKYKNIEMTVWDIGGQDILRPLWKHYYQNTDAVIFVVDSNDQERLEMVREELFKVLASDELRNSTLLVFANKQDLPKSSTVEQVSTKLRLHELKCRKWFIQGCCAADRSATIGLYEGLDWLSKNLPPKNSVF